VVSGARGVVRMRRENLSKLTLAPTQDVFATRIHKGFVVYMCSTTFIYYDIRYM